MQNNIRLKEKWRNYIILGEKQREIGKIYKVKCIKKYKNSKLLKNRAKQANWSKNK